MIDMSQSPADDRFRIIFEASPVTMMLLDEDGFFDCNRATLELFELDSVEAFASCHPSDLSPANQPCGMPSIDLANQRIQYAYQHGYHQFEWQHRKKSGTCFPAMVRLSRMALEGRTVLLAIVTDLSAVKEAEQLQKRIAQKQRLESLGLLAGGVAHDFNNLLMPIIGHLELAILQSERDGRSSQGLNCALDATRHAARLSRKMLSYAGSGRMFSTVIGLGELISQMRSVLAASVAGNVHIEFNLDKKLPAVGVDIAEIEQVLLNLVINASDAIGEAGGIIRISTLAHDLSQDDLIRLHCEKEIQPGRYIAFRVQDNGCGMTEEVQEKLFDPFFTTKFTGRGLGLSAVQGIIQSHKGVLQIESTQGAGTCFTVSFAMSSEPEAKPEVEAKPTHAVGGKILIVDDDESIRMVSSHRLKKLGYSSFQACGGQQAVDLYLEHQADIDAVILDMTMPVMNGSECFARLKAVDPNVKVILSSGYAQDDVVSQFAEGALAGYLPKPYSMHDLENALNNILR